MYEVEVKKMITNFDNDEIYNVETGKTVEDIELLEPKHIELLKIRKEQRNG